jgi:hypothetical protein
MRKSRPKAASAIRYLKTSGEANAKFYGVSSDAGDLLAANAAQAILFR